MRNKHKAGGNCLRLSALGGVRIPWGCGKAWESDRFAPLQAAFWRALRCSRARIAGAPRRRSRPLRYSAFPALPARPPRLLGLFARPITTSFQNLTCLSKCPVSSCRRGSGGASLQQRRKRLERIEPLARARAFPQRRRGTSLSTAALSRDICGLQAQALQNLSLTPRFAAGAARQGQSTPARHPQDTMLSVLRTFFQALPPLSAEAFPSAATFSSFLRLPPVRPARSGGG